MSGVPSTPSTPGGRGRRRGVAAGRRGSAMASESPRTASAPRAGWSAATMKSLPSSPSRGRLRARRGRATARDGQRGCRAGVGCRGSRLRRPGRRCARRGPRSDMERPPRGRPRPRRSSAWRSSTRSGWRRSPPAALAKRRTRSRSQPASSPWQSAPPKPSPEPRPLITLTRCGRTSTLSSRVFASTPFGPCLTIASSTPRSSSASAARARIGLADGDLALLAVADRDGHVLEGAADLAGRGGGRRPEHRAGSRGRGRWHGAAGGARACVGDVVRLRLGSSREAGDGGPEDAGPLDRVRGRATSP